jgi:hypothetical protein
VKSLLSDAKQETTRIAETARERVGEAVAQKKDQAAQQVGSVAGALREAGEKLQREDVAFGRLAENVAGQAERLSQYLRSHDLQTVVRDAEAFARRHPEIFLGGAVVAGMVATRFLKSSAPREHAAGPYSPAPVDPFNKPHYAAEEPPPPAAGGGFAYGGR